MPQTQPKTSRSPRDMERMLNCRPVGFRKSEDYPSILPAISRCDPVMTQETLADPVEGSCQTPFDWQHDDIVEVWKASRARDKEGYYGLGTDMNKPEAEEFDRLIAKSLRKAGLVQPKKPPPAESSKSELKRENDPPADAILNRSKLMERIQEMPFLTEALRATKLQEWWYCPQKYAGDFLAREKAIPLKTAIGMDRLDPPKTEPGRRFKHFVCDSKCGLPENELTLCEWMNHKMNMLKPDRGTRQQKDEAFIEDEMRREQAEAEAEKMEMSMRLKKELDMGMIASFETLNNLEEEEVVTRQSIKYAKRRESAERRPPEPKNYDELYDRLVPCFEYSSEKSREVEFRGYIEELVYKVDPAYDESPREWDKRSESSEGSEGSEKNSNRRQSRKRSKNLESGKGGRKGRKSLESGEGGHESRKSLESGEGSKKSRKSLDSGKGGRKGRKSLESGEGGQKSRKSLERGKGGPKSRKSLESGKGGRKGRKSGKGGRKGRKNGKGGHESRKIHKFPIKSSRTAVHPDLLESGVEPELEAGPPEKKKRKPKKLQPQEVEPAPECSCDVCEFMQRWKNEPDSPLIQQMRNEQKRRELLDYYKRKFHRQYIKDEGPELQAPQRKCDPIADDNSICVSAKAAEYCDYLDALTELKKQVRSDQMLRSKISCLQARVNQRLSTCYS